MSMTFCPFANKLNFFLFRVSPENGHQRWYIQLNLKALVCPSRDYMHFTSFGVWERKISPLVTGNLSRAAGEWEIPVTCGEIFRSHTTKDVKCIFSHDTHRKAAKIPFLNEISLNIVRRHDKLLTSYIGAQEVVPRIVLSLFGIYVDVWTQN